MIILSRPLSFMLSPFKTAALSLAALLCVPLALDVGVEAKTPGKTYCFYGVCHRVKTVEETQLIEGQDETLQTSFYDDCKNDRYNPCGLTSSGERFRADKPDNAASPVYPDGTTLLVWNPGTKGAAVVRVNNAGPYWGKRKLDVSRAAAEKLGFTGNGTAPLKVKVVKAPNHAEASYQKNRRYRPVPGYIGKYDNAEQAEGGAAAMMALNAIAGTLLAPVKLLAALTGTDAATSEPAAVAVASAPQVNRKARTAHAKTETRRKSVRVASSRRSKGGVRTAQRHKRQTGRALVAERAPAKPNKFYALDGIRTGGYGS